MPPDAPTPSINPPAETRPITPRRRKAVLRILETTAYMLIIGARNNSASKVFTKEDMSVLKGCFKKVLPASGFTILKGLGGWFSNGLLKEEHSRALLFTTDKPDQVRRLLNLLVATFQQSSIMVIDLGLKKTRFYDGRAMRQRIPRAKWRRELYDEVDI
jgi:hypothetical protein